MHNSAPCRPSARCSGCAPYGLLPKLPGAWAVISQAPDVLERTCMGIEADADAFRHANSPALHDGDACLLDVLDLHDFLVQRAFTGLGNTRPAQAYGSYLCTCTCRTVAYG